ncbi:hypothetical protein GOODEAATRI_010577 [Goodea atripinnis]|uniref:Secreted protein n=1 Tax=Goodea atripinnis TaxID=208336 RepID=A0ABV0NAI5_9TELE
MQDKDLLFYLPWFRAFLGKVFLLLSTLKGVGREQEGFGCHRFSGSEPRSRTLHLLVLRRFCCGKGIPDQHFKGIIRGNLEPVC